MVTTADDQGCWTLPAAPSTVGRLRAQVTAFADAAGAPSDLRDAVALAVSEAVTNVVVHAYPGAGEAGAVRVRCRVADGQIVVEVADDGIGIGQRNDSPGVGHGL